MKRVFLVSCVSKKKTASARAAEMYVSSLFLKERNRIEKTGCPWFILSAKYGLLDPDKIIEPYNVSLNTMSAKERRAWAEKVRQQMESQLPNADKIVIFAGATYRRYLLPYLERRFPNVEIPMQRLKIGQQLQWLDHAPEI